MSLITISKRHPEGSSIKKSIKKPRLMIGLNRLSYTIICGSFSSSHIKHVNECLGVELVSDLSIPIVVIVSNLRPCSLKIMTLHGARYQQFDEDVSVAAIRHAITNIHVHEDMEDLDNIDLYMIVCIPPSLLGLSSTAREGTAYVVLVGEGDITHADFNDSVLETIRVGDVHCLVCPSTNAMQIRTLVRVYKNVNVSKFVVIKDNVDAGFVRNLFLEALSPKYAAAALYLPTLLARTAFKEALEMCGELDLHLIPRSALNQCLEAIDSE